MKIKALLLSCFLFFIAETIFSQEVKPKMYSIDSIPEYKVINPEMCKAIDTVLFFTKDCAYYSALNNLFLLRICIYGTFRFSIESLPYSCSLINLLRSDSRIEEEGFCNYKGCLVFITSFIPNYINHFFESTGTKSNLYYHNSENLEDHVFRAYQNVTIFFHDKNGKFAFDSKEDLSLCRKNYCFSYVVQAEDTWQDIATKCGCSIEDLTEGYKDAEKPIAGNFILINYYFNEGKLVKAKRWQ
jgi:hypothetical protein